MPSDPDLSSRPTAPPQALYLEVIPVIVINQGVNLTAVLPPPNPNLTVFYGWISHSVRVRGPRAPGGPPGSSHQGLHSGRWAGWNVDTGVRAGAQHAFFHLERLLRVQLCPSVVGTG